MWTTASFIRSGGAIKIHADAWARSAPRETAQPKDFNQPDI
jgi:hypothetical protein